MRRSTKTRLHLGGLLLGLPLLILGGYYAVLTLGYSSGPRTVPPVNLVKEYDGPGALRNQPSQPAPPEDDGSN